MVLMCAVLTGCRQEDAVGDGVPAVVREVEDDAVLLEDVVTPMYQDVFATVSVGGYCSAVCWGSAGSGGCYAVPDSGYPGFGFPMLFVSSDASTGTAIGAGLKVDTQYGIYHYRVEGSFDAVLSDSGRNVVDCATGRELLEWGRAGEVLVVFFADGRAVRADLVHGTEIVVR